MSTYMAILILIITTLITLILIGSFILMVKDWFMKMFVEPSRTKQIKKLESEVEYWKEKFEFLPVAPSDVKNVIDCKLVRDENHIPIHSVDEDGNGVFTLRLVMKKPDEEGLLKR